MRYMFLTSGAETGAIPPQAMIDAIEKLTEQEIAAGRMIARGGLMPTAMGSARIESRRGRLKLTDGPFAETKEVLGGFAIFEFATREDALAAAQSFMELHPSIGPNGRAFARCGRCLASAQPARRSWTETLVRAGARPKLRRHEPRLCQRR